MATVRRSKDHSIWFSHITDAEGAISRNLRNLVPGQGVVLKLGVYEGLWRRFAADSRGKTSPGLSCGDANAKKLWNSIKAETTVPIDIVRVLPASNGEVADQNPQLKAILGSLEDDVLCIGVDVAWSGGNKSDAESRSECLAYSTRVNRTWGPICFRRVDLNGSFNRKADPYTPNADPQADTLVTEILKVHEEEYKEMRLVISVDAPILSNDRDLPPRKKANKKKEKGGTYRECDFAWMAGQESSPRAWKGFNPQPGAPLYPRVAALVRKLRCHDVSVYGDSTWRESRKLLIECFPNEILWGCGILNLLPLYNSETVRLYKKLGKKRTPLPGTVFKELWRLPMQAAFIAARLHEQTQQQWLSSFHRHLIHQQVYNPATDVGVTGKRFDDAVDSVLSLSAAVAITDGVAHVHQGSNPLDGHIIGPGHP